MTPKVAERIVLLERIRLNISRAALLVEDAQYTHAMALWDIVLQDVTALEKDILGMLPPGALEIRRHSNETDSDKEVCTNAAK